MTVKNELITLEDPHPIFILIMSVAQKNAKKLKELEVKPKGDPSKISQAPGQVTWDDIKVYMEKKRSSGN